MWIVFLVLFFLIHVGLSMVPFVGMWIPNLVSPILMGGIALGCRSLETGGDLGRALRRWPHDPDFFVLREAATDERLPWDFLDQGVTKRFLAREYRRGVGAKVTPKCAVETCRACGLACADHPELVPGPVPPAP